MFTIAERALGHSEDVEDAEEGSSWKHLCGADLPIPSGLCHACLVNDIVRARAIAECGKAGVGAVCGAGESR